MTPTAGHVSLGQLKVMGAIERCRTAALGGHVLRCENDALGNLQLYTTSPFSGLVAPGVWALARPAALALRIGPAPS